MKPPPLLLFAALLFWGWQSDFLITGAILGAVLELPRVVKFRWELDDTDFNRIWSFCFLLNVVLAGYVFTNNDAGGLNGMLHGNTVTTAANSSVLTATRFLRWLPLTTFAFLAAQVFNERPSVPLTAISLVLRWRRRHGDRAFAGRYLDISYPYFFVCLFSAGIHTNTGVQIYFWGQGFLIAWALWAIRSRRVGIVFWLLALAAVFALGVAGMAGINRAQGVIQNFNAQWLAQFLTQRTDPLQSMTSMGRIGRLKLSAKIVIRLEPRRPGEAPPYLREASYRRYSAQTMTWHAGGATNNFEPLSPEGDGTSWILLPEKKPATAVNLACYLNGRSKDGDPEGLLPLPGGCARLENVPPYMILKTNQNGAVLAAGRGLVIFDALYGHGATLDSPPDEASTNRFDLTVPTNEVPALQKIISEINFAAEADDLEKRRAVEIFFLNQFTYSTWQGNEKLAARDVSPLTKFLLTSRSGHCEYFASAAVLLLRQLGIPARYAVGYSVHETRGSGFVVRARDAHAWCLAWNRATKTWDDFDTTPASWVAIETKRTEFGEWFADLRSWISFQFAKLRWRQAQLQQYIFWSLIPVMLVLLYHIVFKRRGKLRSAKNRNKNAASVNWPGLDSEFYALEKKLAARGVPRQTGEPLAVWLERALAEPALATLRLPLSELLRLHYAHRFDPAGLTAEKRTRLKREAVACLEKISSVRAAKNLP